jgi:hypothetical protein
MCRAAARELAAEGKLAEAAELEAKLAASARKDAAAALAEEQAALRCACQAARLHAGKRSMQCAHKQIAGNVSELLPFA